MLALLVAAWKTEFTAKVVGCKISSSYIVKLAFMWFSSCRLRTELTRDDRRKLYSSFGSLHPYGHEELIVCEDIDQFGSSFTMLGSRQLTMVVVVPYGVVQLGSLNLILQPNRVLWM